MRYHLIYYLMYVIQLNNHSFKGGVREHYIILSWIYIYTHRHRERERALTVNCFFRLILDRILSVLINHGLDIIKQQ